MKTVSIANNADLCFIPSEKFKTNLISVCLISPLRKETASLNSLLNFVLKRGTKSYPDITMLNKQLESMYGASLYSDIKKKGEAHIIKFGIEFLDNSVVFEGEDLTQKSLDLLMEIIFSPFLVEGAFSQEYVESEKNNLIDLINGRINDKRTYAIIRCFEEMCKDEKFGVYEYGDIDKVKEITPKILFEHYQNMLDTAKVVIFCIGRFDENNIINKIKTFFTKQRNSVPISTDIVKTVKSTKNISERIEVEQAKLTMGFRTGLSAADENITALTLFNNVFGGGPHSKLFENVRERQSLCYYCASRIEKHKGLLIVYSGIDEINKDKAQNEILNQLELIKKGEITETEFDDAKKALTDAYKSASDSMASMEDWYLGQILSGEVVSLEKEAEKINALTIQEIVDVSQNVTLDTIYLLGQTLKEGK